MSLPLQQDGLFSLYPPRIAASVDVTEQIENGISRFIIRNTASSRYFVLKAPEYSIFRQLDGTQTLIEIATSDKGFHSPRVTLPVLIKFIAKLDTFGLLERGGPGSQAQTATNERGPYIRFRLFNPNDLLTQLDRTFGWVLSRPIIIATFALMVVALFGLLSRADEVGRYMIYSYSEYARAIIIAALAIALLHEFAHGWACKRFGGDVPEVGVLMVFYVIPALYCNVSDIYRIGKKSQRLWVIFAGIYWQLCISTLSALLWLIATPYSLLADASFVLLLGGSLNILFNCNPLIKLDGYYALSQFLGIPNLQTRSTNYVRSWLTGLLEGKLPLADSRNRQEERPLIYLAYWLSSLLYSILLIWFILAWAGDWLMNNLGFVGVVWTVLLAGLLTERWWKPLLVSSGHRLISFLRHIPRSTQGRWNHFFGHFRPRQSAMEGGGIMSVPAKQSAPQPEPISSQTAKATETSNPAPKRRRIIKWSFIAILLAVLILPWEASTGSDCTLLLPPGRENIVRANTDAVLTEIYVQQGDAVMEGTRLARLANPEVEDRLKQLDAEIERLTANGSRLEDELKMRSEILLSANFKEQDRQRIAKEYQEEAKQMSHTERNSLPAALAVLQSEIDLKQTELDYNRREVERYKKLLEQGLIGEQIYDRAVAAVRLSERELQSAKVRLEAAKVEHRRQTNNAETNSLVAETESRAARSSFEALISELHANREQRLSYKQRRDLLAREYEGMNLMATRSGVVLGEDLHKVTGRRYGKGEEICRIGELETFLLRVDVSEREIASVTLNSSVRFKLKTLPGKTFTGYVAKINAEPITNQQGQRFYPVEVVVENSDGLLRPGMTGFARISFGKTAIAIILANKIWQSLRPELWLF